jgi:hypothetical protein
MLLRTTHILLQILVLTTNPLPYMASKVSITLTGRTTVYNILKIRSACFAMRKVTPLMTTDTSNLVHFGHFHSIVSQHTEENK